MRENQRAKTVLPFNYLNIIRYMEKIMRLHAGNKRAAAALYKSVEQEDVLTEKVFFQKILHVMQ